MSYSSDNQKLVVGMQAGGFVVPLAIDVEAQGEGESGSVDWVVTQALGPRTEALAWLEGMVRRTDVFEVPIGRMVLAAKAWIAAGQRWDWNKAAKVANVTSEQVAIVTSDYKHLSLKSADELKSQQVLRGKFIGVRGASNLKKVIQISNKPDSSAIELFEQKKNCRTI